MTTKEIIAALENAMRANLTDKNRRGNVIHLSPPGDVVMTGDLHGNEANFDKLLRYANLKDNPNRHLILHEILHCPNSCSFDQCHSYLLLARAAALKSEFPDQVHCLLGNHAMAQFTREEILKNGQPMVRSLNAGIAAKFGDSGNLVINAIDDFILSLPLAVRTENRIWMSHSLPSLRHLKDFDTGIFDRAITRDDMQNNKSLRALLWDRCHVEQCLEKLQDILDSDIFVVGHQPQEQGYAWRNRLLFILASDHCHGCFLPFSLEKKYEPEEFAQLINPLASVY